MPHRTQMQVIKRRLVGKVGKERVEELRKILGELPGYRSGPYADIRKWENQEIERSFVRHKAVHRDSIAIRREGAAQIALVGPPNAGKSSLLRALTDIQIRVGDYIFTTLRPVAAVANIGGVLIQLVEIPGLLPGAAKGRGKGRALLGVLREADAIVFCYEASAEITALTNIRDEVAAAGIEKPWAIAITKIDEAGGAVVARVEREFPNSTAVGVSVLDESSLENFKEVVWNLTGLLRVFTRRGKETAEEPLALPIDATVGDVAEHLHKELAAEFRGARVWGSSARFPGQQVGVDHAVADGDIVEILT
jgi:small GTP-binding protein